MDKRNNSLLDRKFEIYRNNNENRELERGGLLGINCRDDDTITKLNNNVNSLYDKNSNNTGEITGLKINNFDLLQGMPMRQEMKNKVSNKKPISVNMDFNIYNRKVLNNSYSNNIDNEIKSISTRDLDLANNKESIPKNIYNDLNCFLFSSFQESLKKRSKLTIATLPILKNLIILYCCSSNNTNRKLNKVFGGVTRDEIYGVLKQISNKKLNSKFLNSVNLIMISNNLPLNTNFKKYVESNCRIESYSNNSLQESNRINNIIEKLESSDNLNNIIMNLY